MKTEHQDRTTKFLATSLAAVLVFSIAIFTFLAVFFNKQSASTIQEVSQMYMAGMSEQIAMHFDTTIGLRLDQLDTLVETVASERVHDNEALRNHLIFNARACDFPYLAFYHADGTFEMLYGEDLFLDRAELFLGSLLNISPR